MEIFVWNGIISEVIQKKHGYLKSIIKVWVQRQNTALLLQLRVNEPRKSRPKASTGQWYPCPAISGSAKARCRQGSGRCPVEHRGKIPSIHPSISLFVLPSTHPSIFEVAWASLWIAIASPRAAWSCIWALWAAWASPGGGTYGQTSGQKFSPVFCRTSSASEKGEMKTTSGNGWRPFLGEGEGGNAQAFYLPHCFRVALHGSVCEIIISQQRQRRWRELNSGLNQLQSKWFHHGRIPSLCFIQTKI